MNVRTVRAWLALLALVTLARTVLACAPTSHSSPPGAQEAAHDGHDGTRVEILSHGAPPHIELRMSVAVGAVQEAILRVRTETRTDGESAEHAPTIEMPTRVTIVRANNAQIRYRHHILGFDVAADGATTTTSEPLLALRSRLRSHEGYATLVDMSTQGQVHDARVEHPEKLSEWTRSLASGQGERTTATATVLPRLPVGVGARWRVSASPPRSAVVMTQTIDYELLSLHGDVAELSMSVVQSAAEQRIVLRDGAMFLRQYAGKGTGRGTLSLRQVLPLRWEYEHVQTMLLSDKEKSAGADRTDSMDSIRVEVRTTMSVRPRQ